MGLSEVCATWFRNNCLLDTMAAIYKEAKLSTQKSKLVLAL